MASNLYKVFVYGTLKKGEPNHNWFSKAAEGKHKFICEAETIEKYPLIIGTKYNIPFLLHHPGQGHNVRGEVYEVDDKVLADLDVLEDHPNYYVRNEYVVRPIGEDANPLRAWIYFIHNYKSDLLKRPTFASYSNNGDHGLKYVTSEMSSVEDLNNLEI